MSPAGFEPAIPASEWPHIYALGTPAIGIGHIQSLRRKTNQSAKLLLQAVFFFTSTEI